MTLVRLFKVWIFPAISFNVLTIEFPAVAAIVSRGENGQNSLAAFGVVLGIIATINSIGIAIGPVSASIPLDKTNRRVLRQYIYIISAVIFLLTFVLTISPLSIHIFERVFGIGQEISELVKAGVLILSVSIIIVCIRRYLQGLFIKRALTPFITIASVVRIATSISVATVLLQITTFTGMVIGSVALMCGATLDLSLHCMANFSRPNGVNNGFYRRN